MPSSTEAIWLQPKRLCGCQTVIRRLPSRAGDQQYRVVSRGSARNAPFSASSIRLLNKKLCTNELTVLKSVCLIGWHIYTGRSASANP